MPFRTSSIYNRSLFLISVFTIVFCLAANAAFAQQPAADAKPVAAASSTGLTSTAPQATPAQAASPQSSHEISKPSQTPGIDPKTMTPLYETIQEDWGSLQIGTSRLEPEPPVVGEVDDEPNFTRVLVQVKWRPGDPIDLWIILPKGVKNPPAVLYLYGADQDTSRFRDNNWCQRVSGGGVAAVGFVAALTGPRFHDRPMKQWFISELQESLGSTVHDVRFILDYLAERHEVAMSRIGMFGEGYGGAIAILAAAADTRIKAVDTLDPWGDWPKFLAESPVVQEDPDHARYVKPEFLKQVANLDPVKWLPELKVPVRIQQIHQNEAMPLVCKDDIKAAAPKQAETLRFEGPTDLAKKEGRGILFEWMKERLQSAKPDGTKAEVAAKGVRSRDDQQQRDFKSNQ
jgi:hypothetical protein